MNGKSFAAGILCMYGLMVFLSVFGVSLIFSLPIIAFGVDIGRLVLAILLFAAAYYLAK